MSANGSSSRGAQPLTAAGLVAVVAAVVLGILGMHSLTQHGSAPVHGSQQTVAAPTADPHAAHPAPDHEPVATGSDASKPVEPAGFGSTGDHESASDMVMLCAAMLLAAAAGVLGARRLMRVAVRTPRSLIPRPRVLAFAATARAGTGPPPTWEFSVIRC